MWEELRYQGESCSRNRVARLMKGDGLRGIPQRRRWRKKTSGTRPDHVQNHLARDFTADEPNTKWVTDITYIRTAEGWLYLAAVVDLYSGRVVGWSMSPRQDRQLVLQAVLMALWQRKDRSPVILHSDRGCQPRFKGSSQQSYVCSNVGDRSATRQGSSIQGSCVGAC
jgi:putative transposase